MAVDERGDRSGVLGEQLIERDGRHGAQHSPTGVDKTDWRLASYAIGLERLQHCYRERGIFRDRGRAS
jgi:hypothetical protein